jgi:hypothetical protein
LSWAEFRAGTPQLVTPQAVLPGDNADTPASQPAEPATPLRVEPVNGSG